MFHRRSQTAIEFMIIFVFIIGLMSLFMVIIGVYTQDLTISESRVEIDAFAKSLTSEFEILANVEEGFNREVIIPSNLLKKYNVTIVENYLVVEDLFAGGTREETSYFYELSGDLNYVLTSETNGDLKISLKTEDINNFDSLNLDMLIQGLTTVGTNLSASFSSSACGVGYSRLYGLDALSDAHAEAPSSTDYTYNLCITHDSYTMGNSCSGTYERLFYLGNVSNSHMWIDNSSAYAEPWVGYYNWTEVCVSSSGGTTDLTYSSSDLSGSGYVCLGSYLQNDTIGGHVGDCSAYSNKIWFSLS
jgi:hypothetical protein